MLFSPMPRGHKHGNPNVLTRDCGSSRLGQGCSAQTCFVDIALYRVNKLRRLPGGNSRQWLAIKRDIDKAGLGTASLPQP
jgi:hypothetical protein